MLRKQNRSRGDFRDQIMKASIEQIMCQSDSNGIEEERERRPRKIYRT